jgi:hypothetical protein
VSREAEYNGKAGNGHECAETMLVTCWGAGERRSSPAWSARCSGWFAGLGRGCCGTAVLDPSKVLWEVRELYLKDLLDIRK